MLRLNMMIAWRLVALVDDEWGCNARSLYELWSVNQSPVSFPLSESRQTRHEACLPQPNLDPGLLHPPGSAAG